MVAGATVAIAISMLASVQDGGTGVAERTGDCQERVLEGGRYVWKELCPDKMPPDENCQCRGSGTRTLKIEDGEVATSVNVSEEVAVCDETARENPASGNKRVLLAGAEVGGLLNKYFDDLKRRRRRILYRELEVCFFVNGRLRRVSWRDVYSLAKLFRGESYRRMWTDDASLRAIKAERRRRPWEDAQRYEADLLCAATGE